MNEVKRFRAYHRHVVETEFDDAQYVGVADFDRVLAEREALQQRLTKTDQRVDELEGLLLAWYEANAKGLVKVDDAAYHIVTATAEALNPIPKPTCCGACPAGCIGAKP